MSQEDGSPSRLNKTQWRLVATAAGVISFTIIVAFLLGVFFVLRSFVDTFASVLWPLAVAGVLSLILRPFVAFLQNRMKMSRAWAIISLYVLAAGVIAAMLGIVLPELIDQTIRLIHYLPELSERISATFAEHYPNVVDFLEKKIGPDNLAHLKDWVANVVAKLLQASEPALANIADAIGTAVTIGTGLAIIPVYLFFFLETNRDLKADLREQLSFIRESWREDALFLINEFVGSVVSFFRGQIIIAFIMGTLLGLGFYFIGLNFAIILGLFIGFLNIIPYLGSIVGFGIVLPMAYFQKDGGGLELLLLSVAVFVVVQMIEGYLLTPKIMGKQTGLHPMLIIVAIFFWGVALNGILGMVLAIPLTAFFVVAWRLAKRKYLDHREAVRRAPEDAPAEPKQAPKPS